MNLVCTKCGDSQPSDYFDVLQLPAPERCAQVYNGPKFPADVENPEHHISGPCNGVLKRTS